MQQIKKLEHFQFISKSKMIQMRLQKQPPEGQLRISRNQSPRSHEPQRPRAHKNVIYKERETKTALSAKPE